VPFRLAPPQRYEHRQRHAVLPRTAAAAFSSSSSSSDAAAEGAAAAKTGAPSLREYAAQWANCFKDAEDPSAEVTVEMARLTEDITRHDARYYNDAAPLVSDAEYDRLRLRLEAGSDTVAHFNPGTLRGNIEGTSGQGTRRARLGQGGGCGKCVR
jgi:hypothetical protein